MKSISIGLLITVLSLQLPAQQSATQALPKRMFAFLRDSTTSIDVVFMIGSNGSLSMDGKNVQIFNMFFQDTCGKKLPVPQAASIMWQVEGREYLTGQLYINDEDGCIVFSKDNKEYVNRISPAGVSFFKGQLKPK